MPKQEGIVIKDWQKGMGTSALTGFYMLKNTDLSEPGLIRPNFTLAKESGTTITAQSVMAAVDPSTPANIYVLGFASGTNAQLYRSTDSGDTWVALGAVTLTSSLNPTALAIWKGYLFCIGTKKIDVVKISDLSTSLDWTTDALDPTGSYAGDSSYHPVLVGADDVLYIGNGRYITSITEAVGATFAPGTAASYTLNAAALTLPADCRVRTLDWLNNRLLIGTWNGTGTVNARIYKWDGISDFESPVSLNEVAVKAGITVGNLYYFFAGGKCDLYVTDGNTAKFISHLPWQVLGVLAPDSTLDIKPQGIMYKGGKIYFGLFSGAVATGNLRGLWSYDLNTGAFNYEQMISTANDGNTNYLSIDWVLNYNGARHFVGWNDNNTSWGIDQISTTRYGTYTCVIQTPLYQVGTKDNKRTFSRVEAQFARKFSTDQFRFSYRTNLTDSFTTITNLTTTADNTLSLSEGCPLQDLENVQFQIELSNNASLIEVRVN